MHVCYIFFEGRRASKGPENSSSKRWVYNYREGHAKSKYNPALYFCKDDLESKQENAIGSFFSPAGDLGPAKTTTFLVAGD
jgi:hypothetical protein